MFHSVSRTWQITLLAVYVCTSTVIGEFFIQRGTGDGSATRIFEDDDEYCDMSRMTVDWIPCTGSSDECKNVHFPQKMVSLTGRGLCPTGCRCYRLDPPDEHRHARAAATKQEQAAKEAPSGPATCYGGWYFFDNMCYTLTPALVSGHDVQAACSSLKAEPVFIKEEEGRDVVTKLLDISGKQHAWVLLHSDKMPPTPDWSVWIKCIYGSCKCTSISEDGTWATRNCNSKYLATCRRKPSYRGGEL